MSEAKRMHGLMIGQPNFAAQGGGAKVKRGAGGKFVKASAPAATAAAETPAPKALVDQLKDEGR